ncbi:MAG: hypothetical protein QOF70_3092 [Acetobacteraceae bacterium]|jgi:hypothetical protein|nr:hypothetical protein [Acetobacteraceae bacterium]
MAQSQWSICSLEQHKITKLKPSAPHHAKRIGDFLCLIDIIRQHVIEIVHQAPMRGPAPESFL